MVDDDDGIESPSLEPRTDSRSGLPMKNMRWRLFSSKGELTILENDSRYCILPDRTFPFIYENINSTEIVIKEYEGVEKISIVLNYISNVYKIIALIY